MSKIEKAYAITDAKISFVSLVDKAANKKQFLITKAEHGSASFASYGRIVNADADSHYITGIVYEPLTEDAHGNYMTEQEITKAAYWFAKNGNQVDACKNVGIFKFGGNCNKAYWMYYYLKSPQAMEFIKAHLRGTTQLYVPLATLREMPVPVPDEEEMNKIVAILRTLDDKIQCSIKINDNLEQQAQAIFKEWFIENPENNEWSTGTFSELIKTTLNGDWGKEAPTGNNTEKVYCIRGADIPEVKAGNKGKMPTRYILPKNFVKKQLTAGDIVVEISGGSPTQSTGRCTAITQSLLDRYDSGMVCTNFCKAIKPKEGYSLFIYYYWQYLYGKGIFFSYENGTTGIKNLDFSGFIETETILIPPVDKVIAFDDYCKSIFNQIFANGKQNEHLAVLRDTLLPKLMSGELDVSDIDL